MTQRTGECLCGAIKDTLLDDPLVARTCWCRLCQYIGSGNATVNGIFKKSDVEIFGNVKSVAVMPDSGFLKHHHFCPECGTQIGGTTTRTDEIFIVRLGILDEPDIAPEATIWTSTAPSWACIADDIPQMPEGAPAPQSKS